MAKPSTQSFLDIDNIESGILTSTDGSACMVLEVAAINFGLFSEKEQEATIYAYAQLLNSLTFPLQIVLISRRKDISEYLSRLDAAYEKAGTDKLKEQLSKYRDFIKSIVRQGNVLDKKFYIAIPFSSLELGVSSSAMSLFGKKPQNRLPKADLIEKALTNLSPKRDALIRLLARIGLRARQLESNDLLQFFFNVYNPGEYGVVVEHPTEKPATDDSFVLDVGKENSQTKEASV